MIKLYRKYIREDELEEIDYLNPRPFSDDAINIRIPKPIDGDNHVVYIIKNEGFCFDPFLVMLIREALSAETVVLDMNYLPYGRQDRDFSNMFTMEPVSLKPFLDVIKMCDFNQIILQDIHNEEYLTQIYNACSNTTYIPQHVGLKHFLKRFNKNDVSIIFPDAGAAKKYHVYGEYDDMCKAYFIGNKKRENGNIKISIPDNLLEFIHRKKSEGNIKSQAFVVVDDICDGGGTFIPYAEAINKAIGVNPEHDVDDLQCHLYVTHGIFSKGKDELLKHYYSVNTSKIDTLTYVEY